MKIAISSDSTCAISQDEAKNLGIFVLPLNVIVDGNEYHDGITINQNKLKDMMRGGSKIQTSTPTPYEIENYFDNIFAQGYEKIIHFTISSKLSSMFSLFTITCKEKYEDKIIVIDSLSICFPMKNSVLRAKKLIEENVSFEETAEIVKKFIDTETIYFIPESLTFLKNGGRVSPAIALIGNMLGIKPLLGFTGGEIIKQGTVRTYRKGYLEMFEALKSKNLNPNEDELFVLDFDATELADNLENLVKEHFDGFTITRVPLSINVCAHCGPGTVGLGFCKKI